MKPHRHNSSKKPSRILKFILIALLSIYALGCNPDKPQSSIPETSSISATTSAPTTSTTAPSETEPKPTEYVTPSDLKISDTITIPGVDRIKPLAFINDDLNAHIKIGYDSESLHSAQFASVKDKVIIFNADKDVKKMFLLGSEKTLLTGIYTTEFYFWVSTADIASVFGVSEAVSDGTTTLTINGKTLTCTNDKATISGIEESFEAEQLDFEERKVHYINSYTLAEFLGLTLYQTDSGILIYSNGSAFDPISGYYIAEEAEKLFISDSESLEKFRSNQYVDIPHVYKHSENNVTIYTYPSLDLHAGVTAYSLQGADSKGNAPAIVAGQGKSDANSSVIRVFDKFGTVHSQFTAYPAKISGGVQVASAKAVDSYNILTAPYTSSEITVLKAYDVNGASKFEVKPTLTAPYVIASGNFDGSGDCYAVFSANDASKVEFFSASDGALIKSEDTGIAHSAEISVSVDHDEEKDSIIVTVYGEETKAFKYADGKASEIIIKKSENGVYSSAFGGLISTYDATDERQAFSNITVYSDGKYKEVNVGERENKFYSTWAKDLEDTYVDYASFWHIRVDLTNPVMNALQPGSTQAIRSNDFDNFVSRVGADAIAKSATQANMWEPCFTHRWNKIAGTSALSTYKEPETENKRYAALNHMGLSVDYYELSSAFFNGSYAPYIPELERLRTWTLRSYLSELNNYYMKNPENTIAVSPVHEQEIETGENSVGDYNPSMIEGFRRFLLTKYESLEKINKKFKSEFKTVDEIDAPRNRRRGEWDAYPSSIISNPFFNEWAIYNRTIVSQRILEAYREALLAGFPPELIKAHQIPEGDAVSGVLGNADTRISPVDVVLSCGTSYGGTRYGLWYINGSTTFFELARRSGHRNMTLGEYSAMSVNADEAYKQLLYMFESGLMFTHVMAWEGNVANGNIMDNSEEYAISALQSLNIPRNASSGGTGEVHEYKNGDKTYNIVEIGTKDTTPGLLKSVNEDGSFEGSVYLQPFHAAVAAVDIAENDSAPANDKVKAFIYSFDAKKYNKWVGDDASNYNDVIQIRMKAKPGAEVGNVKIRTFCGSAELKDFNYEYEITEENEYIYTLKNQIYLERFTVEIDYQNVEISDLDVTLMFEASAKRFYNETSPTAHTGGISFDVIE